MDDGSAVDESDDDEDSNSEEASEESHNEDDESEQNAENDVEVVSDQEIELEEEVSFDISTLKLAFRKFPEMKHIIVDLCDQMDTLQQKVNPLIKLSKEVSSASIISMHGYFRVVHVD